MHGYRLIARASWDTVFFRIALSPDPNTEDAKRDLNLRELTGQTIQRLQQRLKQKNIQYIATEHTDQTEIRHVHIIALVSAKNLTRGKLSLDDLEALYNGATADALAMREELDEARGIERAKPTPAVTRPYPDRQSRTRQGTQNRLQSGRHQAARRADPDRTDSYRGGSARPPAPYCPNCGPYTAMERSGRLFECPTCGMAVRRSFGLGVEIAKNPSLELSLEEVSGV